MARYGLIGSSYASQSPLADAQMTMNWYVEQIESGLGKSQFALYPSPGTKIAYNLGAQGPVRGTFTINARTVATIGGTFYELNADSSTTNRGALTSDSAPVSLAGGPTQLTVVSAGKLYVYDLNANTLTQVSALDFRSTVSMTAYIDGFFIALLQAAAGLHGNEIQISAADDATSWDITQFAAVSYFPDNVVSMIADHRELWLFGPRATVAYQNTGAFPFPLQPIPGAYIEAGCAAQWSVAKLDNSIFWLGADERGAGIVWRLQGYTPTRVSNHALEFAMQGYSTISDAIAYTFQDQGHSFYHLYFPTANASWRYDVATGSWHQVGWWNIATGKFDAHHSQCHTFNFGKHLLGDWNSGNVYQASIAFADDGGNPLRRVRRAPHISKENKRLFHKLLQIDVETGLGPMPPLTVAALPTSITLKDANGALWTLQVTDAGLLEVFEGGEGAGQTILLTDPALNGWKLGITTGGELTVTESGSSPIALFQTMVSVTGKLSWQLGVDALGRLQTSNSGAASAPRDPQMMVRWSDDGGHTWSNEYVLNCGQAGAYRTRAILRRLGSSRDRVYEISVTDPIFWRVIEGYLEATDYQPSERIAKQMAKVA